MNPLRRAKRIAEGVLSDFTFEIQKCDSLYALRFRRFMIYCDPNAVMWQEAYQRCIESHSFPHIPMVAMGERERKIRFVVPEFVMQDYLPDSEDWVWQPSVCLNLAQFNRQLVKEQHFGGWLTNANGQELIPKKTGRMGIPYVPENKESFDSGWAVERPGYVERIRWFAEKTLDICD